MLTIEMRTWIILPVLALAFVFVLVLFLVHRGWWCWLQQEIRLKLLPLFWKTLLLLARGGGPSIVEN